MMSRSVVIQADPRAQRRRKILAGVSALAIFVVGMLIGAANSLNLYWSSAQENRELRDRVVVQARELESLQQWRVDNETRHDVDSSVLEMVRKELASQQETIAELKRGIRFYKSLMAPGEEAEGVNVRSVDVLELEDSGHFTFRILVQQNARKHDQIIGTLRVAVIGRSDGERKELELSQLSEQVPSADIRLRFKYFQAIDGELTLPEGFKPEQVKVSAKSTKPRRSEISKEFPWSVQEKLSHVGQ